MKIIVLDIDGVLNCSTTKDLCDIYRGIEDAKVELLKQIVDASDAKIALISTWKERYYVDAKKKHLQDDLANYLDEKLKKYNLEIYTVIPDYLDCFNRAQCVLEFLRQTNKSGLNIENFVILDDIDSYYSKVESLKNKYIKTSFYNGGLTLKDVNQAINILNTK